jgi:O-antigen ligase
LIVRDSRSLQAAIPWFLGGFAFFTPFSIAGAHVCLAVATLLLLVDSTSRNEAMRLVHARYLAIPVLLWFIANGLSVAFAVDPAHSAEKLKKLALFALIPLAALSAVRLRLRAILGALLASTVAVSMIGVVTHIARGGGLEARNSGAGGFYMTVAGIAMIVALLALGELLAALKDPRPRRIAFLGGSLAVVGIALLATYTRGSWLGFAAGALVLLRRHRTVLVALAFGAALLVAFGPPDARDRLISIVEPGHPRNAERLLIWKHGLGLFAEHPWTGTGLWIPDELLRGEAESPLGTIRVHSHMHNTPLQIAVTMGVPGLVAFAALIAGFVRLGRLARRAEIHNLWEEGLIAAYPAIVLALLVNGLVEWNFGDSEVLGLFLILTGATLGIASDRRA